MRVDPEQWREWQARLRGLEDLKAEQPRYAWLWDIRIQMLSYFCSRYGRTLPHAEASIASSHAASEEPPRFPVEAPLPRPVPRLRTPDELREVLDDLHITRCESESDNAARRWEGEDF